jgi:hypothetical protein
MVRQAEMLHPPGVGIIDFWDWHVVFYSGYCADYGASTALLVLSIDQTIHKYGQLLELSVLGQSPMIAPYSTSYTTNSNLSRAMATATNNAPIPIVVT